MREAAIESLCVLAESNSVFARQTQDFLVDMFNDEIEEVRLQAIRSLCKISQHLCLRVDQVEIITGVLKVSCRPLRLKICIESYIKSKDFTALFFFLNLQSRNLNCQDFLVSHINNRDSCLKC